LEEWCLFEDCNICVAWEVGERKVSRKGQGE